MRNFFRADSKLNDPIDRLLKEMDEFGPGTSEYSERLDELERLMALQNKETWTRRIDPNQIVTGLASIGGIVAIVAYEQKHVMVSKALGMVLRSKNTNP